MTPLALFSTLLNYQLHTKASCFFQLVTEYFVHHVLSFANSTLVNEQKSLGRQYTENRRHLKIPE